MYYDFGFILIFFLIWLGLSLQVAIGSQELHIGLDSYSGNLVIYPLAS